MSAQKTGRQSPEPDKAPEQVEKHTEGQIGAAPSDNYSQEESDKQKDTELPSNPTHPLDQAADAKISKDGRGPGI